MKTRRFFVVVMYLFASAAPVWAADRAAFVASQKKLAAQGDAWAQSSLGFMYAHGHGVPQDSTEALKWFRLAAAVGLAEFCQFPREHWVHLRTSNVVESPFAAARLRTTAAKRFKRVENATALIWKLLQVAEATFRKLKGAELLPAVYAGELYRDGLRQAANTRQKLAA